MPSAATTSRPSTLALREPYLTTLGPPALVATFPPMRQEPRAPRSRGTARPASEARASKSARIVPAGAESVIAVVSATTSFSLLGLLALLAFSMSLPVDRITSSAMGTPPPTRPVFPPCGTTARRRELRCASVAEASRVVAGNKTSLDLPTKAPVQSVL